MFKSQEQCRKSFRQSSETPCICAVAYSKIWYNFTYVTIIVNYLSKMMRNIVWLTTLKFQITGFASISHEGTFLILSNCIKPSFNTTGFVSLFPKPSTNVGILIVKYYELWIILGVQKGRPAGGPPLTFVWMTMFNAFWPMV